MSGLALPNKPYSHASQSLGSQRRIVRNVCTRGRAAGASVQERVRPHPQPHQPGADRSRCQRAWCFVLSLQTMPMIAHRPTRRFGSRYTCRIETLAASRESSRRHLFEIPSVRSSYICQSSCTSVSTRVGFRCSAIFFQASQ